MRTAKEIAATFFPVGGATTHELEVAILRHMEHHMAAAATAELDVIDAVCRNLVIAAAEDQATVVAVGLALDKVRAAIRERRK